MKIRLFSALVLLLLSVWPLACSREGDESGNSMVRITMPDIQAQGKNKVVAFSVNAPGGWSLTDPTSLSEVLCYAVAVGGPDSVMSKYSCTQVDSTEVFKASLFGGPVIPNQTVTMEIPSGSERSFYILGFAATSEQDCLDFTVNGIPPREKLSAPHIIGTKVVDLVPGELDLDIEISMTGATKFNECEGPFFNPDPAEITISDGPTYDYGDQATGSFTDFTFTLENEGGSAATSVDDIGLAAPYSLKGGSWPGTGGTCGATIASAEICTIVVEYAPTVAGVPTDTIVVSYNDGYNAATSERALTAIASAPAFLAVSNGPTYTYPNTIRTLISEFTFTVTNTGSYVASSIVPTALTAPFSYKGGTYPGTGGDCGGSLASLAACNIVVEFNPPAPGFSADTISFNYIDGAFPASSGRNIQGTGITEASLAIDQAGYDYGTNATGSNSTNVFTVTNSGGASATGVTGTGLVAPYSFQGGTYPGTGGSCGATIAPGPCTIVIDYDPSTVAVHNDTIDINYNDGLAAQVASRALTGTGATPAAISVAAADPYDFGNVTVGNTPNVILTVNNTGGVPATTLNGSGLAGDWSFTGGPFPGTGGDCTATLNSASSCLVDVTYTPSGSGLSSDVINFTYNDGAGPQLVMFNVQGTGQTPALLTISDGGTYNFGSTGTGVPVYKVFTVTNIGESTATGISEIGLAAPYTFRGGPYPGAPGGDCITSLAGGSSTCFIEIEFNPGSVTTFPDTIQLNYNTGVGGASANRPITGTGL